MKRRGWIRVRRYVADGAGHYKPASQSYRRAFLPAHEHYLHKLGRRKGPQCDPDLDYGEFNLHFELTKASKAEFLRRRGPTDETDAWRAELGDELVVWATDERNARRVARRLVRVQYKAPKGKRVAIRRAGVENAAFEFSTGERFQGVRVTYALRVVAVSAAAVR